MPSGRRAFTFPEDSVKSIDGVFVAKEGTKTFDLSAPHKKERIKDFVKNTHFLLTSGASFMSFCILGTKTFRSFLFFLPKVGWITAEPTGV